MPSVNLADQTWWPFAIVAISVLFIIIAITKLKLHAMIALLLAAVLAGLLTFNEQWTVIDKNGNPKEYSGLVGTVEVASKGFGDTARDIAISVALASIIGMSLMHSGAADKVVRRFLAVFGEKRAGWALLWSTYVLSIPIFFDTMFMLMAPLAKALGKRTGKDYMLYAMCVACGRYYTLDDDSSPRSACHGRKTQSRCGGKFGRWFVGRIDTGIRRLLRGVDD